jgi:hypothetical protein
MMIRATKWTGNGMEDGRVFYSLAKNMQSFTPLHCSSFDDDDDDDELKDSSFKSFLLQDASLVSLVCCCFARG